MLGRLVAAVGLVLGVVAIWVNYLPGTKYADDGTLMAFLIILAVLIAISLLAAWSGGKRHLDLTVGAIGAVMFGSYLLIPALTAFSHWSDLDAGAWLGLCSGLTVIGGCIAAMPMGGAMSTANPVAGLLALVGYVLVFVAIWLKVTEGQGSYWSPHGLGHGAGIVLIVLCLLGVLSLGGAQMGTPLGDYALIVAALTFGFTIIIVVGNAFNQLGDVKIGGWLGAIGGLVAVAGVAAMRKGEPATAPAPAAAPPPPAAPSA